jgi:hypothetical protein
MDYYKCENCGKMFDEFEMNYLMAQVDKKCLCDNCRKNMKIYEAIKINSYDEYIVTKEALDSMKTNKDFLNEFDVYTQKYGKDQYKVKFVSKGKQENDPDWKCIYSKQVIK